MSQPETSASAPTPEQPGEPTRPENQWLAALADNPDHSRRYIERWQRIEAAGNDIHGEARLIDAMAPRNARILDAGCGTGRVGGRLAEAGHRVVGVDLDPELIAEAQRAFPHEEWHCVGLAEMDLRDDAGERRTFDIIVSAGNVMGFLSEAERQPSLRNMAAHLGDDGRAVIGFGAGRGWAFDDFLKAACEAGLELQQRFSTWDLRPANDNFIVAVFGRA